MKHKLHIQNLFVLVLKLNTLALMALFLAIIIVLVILSKNTISWQFLTSNWQNADITQGGIFPAILGSFYLASGVFLITLPIGTATSIYINEYNKTNWLRRLVNFTSRVLTGIPSVIYGLFGLAAFVGLAGLGSSLIAAILTLSLMSLPWVIVSTDEALAEFPMGLRESSQALGATKTVTLVQIILPSVAPSILTGIILAISKAIGETAPIILVGATFFLSKLPDSLSSKFLALPYHIFILATQHSSPYARDYAAATALVLIILTLLLNLGVFLIRYKLRRNYS